MTMTSTIPTVGLRLDRSTATAMMVTIQDALIHAVGVLSDAKVKEANMDIFRMTTASLFDRHPDEFDAATFATIQRAFKDATSPNSARMRYLRRTPSKSWTVSAFKTDILGIEPQRGTYLADAYVASVNYLADHKITMKR